MLGPGITPSGSTVLSHAAPIRTRSITYARRKERKMDKEIKMDNEAIRELEIREDSHLDLARSLTIQTPDEYARADQFCVDLKSLEKSIIETFAEAKEKAFQTHRAITSAEAKHLEPVKQARTIIKCKMSDFQEKERKEREAEEARLRQEAQKRAEDEALAQAEAAHKLGDTEQAQAILEAPLVVAPVVLAPTIQKSKTVIRTVTKYRIVNPNLVPREYLTIDEQKIGAIGRATKGTIRIPGVDFFQEKC